ncbi:hypothetical protein Ancab_017672 [Ancistrocladus abbreviatus]
MEKAKTVFECLLESINPQSRRCRGLRINFPDATPNVSLGLYQISTSLAESDICFFDAFGFGYDYYTNDYKLLIKPVGYDRTEFTDKSCFIIGFDLGYETCIELQPPISLEGGSGLYALGVELGVIEGGLS